MLRMSRIAYNTTVTAIQVDIYSISPEEGVSGRGEYGLRPS